MTDTREEFARKDREYFGLIGRLAGVGEWVAQITEYRSASGPRYIFRLQYESGPKRGEEIELQRHEFYVLPTSEIEGVRRKLAVELRNLQAGSRNNYGFYELDSRTLADLISVLGW